MQQIPHFHTICFLCTGNYYRSRYAEEYFNHRARQTGLPWHADSRGLHPKLEKLANPGPMSLFAKAFLILKGVHIQNGRRRPQLLQQNEIPQFEHIIALNAEEHRPYIEQHYPQLKDSIEYWDIKDLYLEPAPKALARIDTNIAQLLKSLSQ